MISRTLARLKPAWTFSRPHPALWLAWLIPVFAWAQLTYPGYFEFHSGFLPIFNVNDALRHLGDPAWAPAIGQPYDPLRGEGALAYRLAAAACLLGAPPVTAVKWVFGASMLAGAVGMFGWSRRQLGSWPALLAGIVYAFSPIALATVYVRGAFAGAALLGLMPWVLWAAAAAVDPGRKRSGVALALALTAAFWTQAGFALWLSAVVLAYILVQFYGSVRQHRRRAPVAALLGWAAGVLLAALGMLPLILGRGMGEASPVVFAEHLVYPHQLLMPGWGPGTSIPGAYDTLTFDLGVVAFGLAVLSVLPLADLTTDSLDISRDRTPGASAALRRTQYFAIVVLLLMVFLSTTLAAGFWELLPGLARTLSYPWQLLLLAAPWLAWLAGTGGRALDGLLAREPRSPSGSNRMDHRQRGELKALSLFGGLIILVLLGSYTYLNPTVIPGPVGPSPVAIFGDNEIALLDAEVTGVPGPGGRTVVSARWQALRPLDNDYTVFVHAVTPDDARWAQVDTMPQDGKLPTSQWRPGQVVADRYSLTLMPDAPITQDYRYLLGLYLWQTGQRLPIGTVEDPRKGDDKVVLAP
jgi:hypothetical protein